MATKNAWPSDSCPVVPTRICSPIAAIAAAMQYSPVCNQNSPAW
jgi:hypothetical protein